MDCREHSCPDCGHVWIEDCDATDYPNYCPVCGKALLESKKMAAVKAARLPGFYVDERGAYGVIIGTVYICCFVNGEDGRYDVTADSLDGNGDFALNLDWESYGQPEDAVRCLRRLLRKHTGGNRK